ncbi:MAG: haloacid dehalogenase-like hydrolase [Solirubrobacteraceae bacterium]
MPLLLLFDIDGTLLAGATEEHRVALHEALLAVHGIKADVNRRPIAPAGRTDREITRAILLDAGIDARRVDDEADAVQKQACRSYARLCPDDLSHTVLTGIPELLAQLSRRKDRKLGLVTGNYEAIARLKLRRAGIGHWFDAAIGAFGSDAEDRAELPTIARRRAGGAGAPYPRELTVVIGDTPRDIACAHADGARSVAVATGPFGVDELRAADAVARDASELLSLLS